MGSTNKTNRLGLSQFADSDKPTWLGDVNSDNKKIDDGIVSLENRIGTQDGQINAMLARIAALEAK